MIRDRVWAVLVGFAFSSALQAPAAPAAQVVSVAGYALYDVCQDIDGVCLYRRQDFTLSVGGSR